MLTLIKQNKFEIKKYTGNIENINAGDKGTYIRIIEHDGKIIHLVGFMCSIPLLSYLNVGSSIDLYSIDIEYTVVVKKVKSTVFFAVSSDGDKFFDINGVNTINSAISKSIMSIYFMILACSVVASLTVVLSWLGIPAAIWSIFKLINLRKRTFFPMNEMRTSFET